MSQKPRESIVSVRISQEAQDRLRALAAERGTSVSELIRSVVAREVSEPVQAPVTAGATSGVAVPTGTTTAAGQAPAADQGFFWGVQSPSAVAGGTITLRS